MLLQKRAKRQVGENVPIIEEEGGVTEAGAGITDTTTRIKQQWLVEESERAIAIRWLLTEDGSEGLGKMMGIERKRANSRLNQTVEGKREKRLVKYGNQRFRKNRSQRRKPRSKSRGKDECSGRRHHRGDS
jgi:hypothetical protein